MFEFQERLWSKPFGYGFPTQAHLIVGKRIMKYK